MRAARRQRYQEWGDSVKVVYEISVQAVLSHIRHRLRPLPTSPSITALKQAQGPVASHARTYGILLSTARC